MYLYESHLGGIYTDENAIPFEELYCETCGDYDTCLGLYNNLEEFWNLLKDHCSIDGSGGWSLQYVYPKMVSLFELDDEVPYENYNEKSQGFCSLSDKEIINKIENFIKQGS